MPLLAITLMLTACATPPPYQKPAMEVPPAFKESALWKAARPNASEVPDDWWLLFNDPVLNDLQKQVAVGNENLKSAAAQVQVARAALGSSRAGLLPTVGSSAAGSLSSAPGSASTSRLYSAAANATWEIDLWGRVASTVSSAQARLQASADDLAGARLSVQALLTQTYFSLRAAESQAALLERSVTAYQRSLALTQNRYTAGIASAADVAQAQTQLKSTQAQGVEANSSRAQLEHAIATLLGKPSAMLNLPRTAALPEAPSIPVQLPASLMERRPDIAAAERRVAAANEQIGIARSAYYPTLSLSASYGLSAGSVAELFSTPASVWSFGVSAAQTLFNAGATRARVEGSEAAHAQAVASYRQTVLGAFQGVEDQLASTRVLLIQQDLRRQASQAADQVEQQVLNRYRSGQVGYTEVISAQATALTARRALVQSMADRQTTAVALIQSLGGGWQAGQ